MLRENARSVEVHRVPETTPEEGEGRRSYNVAPHILPGGCIKWKKGRAGKVARNTISSW